MQTPGRWARSGRALALAILAAVPAARADVPAPSWVPPRPQKYVTDLTGRLGAARVAALNEKLAAVDRGTTNQVLVYVAPRLPPNVTLEEFANRCLHAWGPGLKERDNGALFVVFLDQRVMRIEVGYGLEGDLPDARARQITSDVVKPYFKAGDYAGGIEAGTAAIVAAVHGGSAGPAPPPARAATRPSTKRTWDAADIQLITGLFALVLGLAFGFVTAFRRREEGRGPALRGGFGAGLAAAGTVLAGSGLLAAGRETMCAGFATVAVGGLLLWLARLAAQWRAAAQAPAPARAARRLSLALRFPVVAAIPFLGFTLPAVAGMVILASGAAALACIAGANAIEKTGDVRIRGVIWPLAHAGALAMAGYVCYALATGGVPIVPFFLGVAGAMVGYKLRQGPRPNPWAGFPSGRIEWSNTPGAALPPADLDAARRASNWNDTTSTPDWSSSGGGDSSSSDSGSDFSGGGGDSGGGGSSDSW